MPFNTGMATANFFDQVTQIQAGETLGPVALQYPDFPRSAGWSLNCIIFGQTGKDAEASATAGTDADSFTLTILPAVTALIKGGRKSFVIEATHATQGTYIAERGSLTVLHNPRVATAEMTILAAIRAVKSGLASEGQQTASLDGISLRNMTPDELDAWEAKYIKIVNAQIGWAGGNGGVYAIKMRTPQDNRYAAPWYGPYPPSGR